MATVDDLYRRSIERFIDWSPLDIEIYRPVKVSTTGGGWRYDRSAPTVLPKQRVRIVDQSEASPITSSDGKVQTSNHILVAVDDADIQKGDRFETPGGTMEIRSISRHPIWRIAAEVVNV